MSDSQPEINNSSSRSSTTTNSRDRPVTEAYLREWGMPYVKAQISAVVDHPEDMSLVILMLKTVKTEVCLWKTVDKKANPHKVHDYCILTEGNTRIHVYAEK